VLVTMARNGTPLDRRWVELVSEGLPKIPHHSEGQIGRRQTLNSLNPATFIPSSTNGLV